MRRLKVYFSHAPCRRCQFLLFCLFFSLFFSSRFLFGFAKEDGRYGRREPSSSLLSFSYMDGSLKLRLSLSLSLSLFLSPSLIFFPLDSTAWFSSTRCQQAVGVMSVCLSACLSIFISIAQGIKREKERTKEKKEIKTHKVFFFLFLLLLLLLPAKLADL